MRRLWLILILLLVPVLAFNQAMLLDSANFYLKPIDGKAFNGNFILRTSRALYFTTYDKIIKQQYDSLLIPDLQSYYVYDTLLFVNTPNKLKIYSIKNRELISELICEKLDKHSFIYPSIHHVYNRTVILKDNRIINIQDLTKPFYEKYSFQEKRFSSNMRTFYKNFLFELEYFDADFYSDYKRRDLGTIHVWDISQLQNPIKISSFCITNCPGIESIQDISPTAMVVNDSLIFIAGKKASLRIFDIRNLTNPSLLVNFRRIIGMGYDNCKDLILINNRLLSLCDNTYYLYHYDSTLYKTIESRPWDPQKINVQRITSSIPLGHSLYRTLTAQKDYFLLIDEWFVYEFNMYKQKWYSYRFK